MNGGCRQTKPFETIDEFDIQTTDRAALKKILRRLKLFGVANDKDGNRETGAMLSKIIAKGCVGDMFVEDDTVGFDGRKAIVQFAKFVNGEKLFTAWAQKVLDLWILANHEDRIPSHYHPGLAVGTIQRNDNIRETIALLFDREGSETLIFYGTVG